MPKRPRFVVAKRGKRSGPKTPNNSPLSEIEREEPQIKIKKVVAGGRSPRVVLRRYWPGNPWKDEKSNSRAIKKNPRRRPPTRSANDNDQDDDDNCDCLLHEMRRDIDQILKHCEELDDKVDYVLSKQ